jgi:hypothetical protein
MRYLKVFESFKEPFYCQIDRTDGMDLIETKSVDMSQRTSDILKSFPFKNEILHSLRLKGNPNSSLYVEGSITPGHHFVDIQLSENNIEIVELDDEWFVVRVHRPIQNYRHIPGNASTTFKCDQLDGVLNLLKEIEV